MFNIGFFCEILLEFGMCRNQSICKKYFGKEQNQIGTCTASALRGWSKLRKFSNSYEIKKNCTVLIIFEYHLKY